MQLDQKALEAAEQAGDAVCEEEVRLCPSTNAYAAAIRAYLQAVQPVPVVTDEPEFQTAPDNGTVNEVLAYVLDCARRWEPKARIIGNARAGDIARALTAAASAEPVAWQTEDETRAITRAEYKAIEEADSTRGAFLRTLYPKPLYAAPLPAQGGKADE